MVDGKKKDLGETISIPMECILLDSMTSYKCVLKTPIHWIGWFFYFSEITMINLLSMNKTTEILSHHKNGKIQRE